MGKRITPIDKKTRKTESAERILRLCMDRVKKKMAVFSYVIAELKIVAVVDEVLVCTDGRSIYYNPEMILKRIVKPKQYRVLEERICHIIIHGILGHFEEKPLRHRKLARAVKDVQVYRVWKCLYPDGGKQNALEITLEKVFPGRERSDFIGNELYFQGSHNKYLREKVYDLGRILEEDDHAYWEPEETKGDERREKEQHQIREIWKKARLLVLDGEENDRATLDMSEDELVKKVMRCIKGKLCITHRNKAVVGHANRESHTAYDVILKELLQCSEVCREADEIDKALYQYGLELYGDVPLIEPMEAAQIYKLHTIVIALDTSGSCKDKVDLFLAELRKLFEDIRTSMEIEHICVLQCDDRIQQEKNYYHIEEFRQTKQAQTFFGFGGTSFVPVFEKTDEMAQQEQIDILLYLTDGEGLFPKYETGAPGYPVVFLVPQQEEQHGRTVNIPEWIKRVPIAVGQKEEWE